MAGLPLGALPRFTHGNGGDRGDGDVSDGEVDGASVFAPPSHAPTDASGMVGDLDDVDDKVDLWLKPVWNDDGAASAGVWGTKTRGGGETDADKDDKDPSPGGTYGLLSANWGGHWSNRALQAHMERDVKSTPCQILCLQESEEALLFHLEKTLAMVPRTRAQTARRV